MAGLFGKVSVAITASTVGLATGLRSATKQLSNFASIGSKIGKINLVGALGIYSASAGLMKLGAVAGAYVKIASAVVEEQNRIKIVFGESAEKVLAFGKSAKAIGLSETKALSAAGTFGTLFRNIGITERFTAQYSTTLTALASDMASFNNVTVDDSLRALRSALVGEVEPIRRLGVLLNDAALRQEAFAMGLVNTTRVVLTPQQKLLASYAAIMKQASIQVGDFIRNQATLANQQRILSANLEGFQKQVGDRLIPVFLEWTTAINNVMPALRALVVTFFEFGSETVKGMNPGLTATEILAKTIRNLGGGMVYLRGLLKGVYAGFLQFMLLGSEIGRVFYSNIGGVLVFLEKGFKKLILNVTNPFEKLMNLIARGLKALGAKSLAAEFDKVANHIEAMNDQTAVGLEESLKGVIAAYEQQSAELRRSIDEATRGAVEDMIDPFEAFDKNLLIENMGEAANVFVDMIPQAGKGFMQIAKGFSEQIAASTKDLGAIVVGTAAGETFRNALMRGADPRASVDSKIEENTAKAAVGIEELPDAFASRLGAQFAVASVSV